MDTRIEAQLSDVEKHLVDRFGASYGAGEVERRLKNAVAALDPVVFDYVPILVARRVTLELRVAAATRSLEMEGSP